MGQPEAQVAALEFRRALEKEQAAQARELLNSYKPVYKQLQSDTEKLVRKAETVGLKDWQNMRLERLESLERQYQYNIGRWTKAATGNLTQAQERAFKLGQRGARSITTAGLPNGITMQNMANLGLGWNDLPEDAFVNFVGVSADGKPLGRLFEELGPQSSKKIRDSIGTGIALGKGSRATAKMVQTEAGMPLARALLITRTETGRAFSEATRYSYENNSQIVKGYKRLAAKTSRTCAACIALDGELYPLDEPLNEHPNGRCTMIPHVLDYADMGLDVPAAPAPENARDWLQRQPEELQREILGDRRYEAIQDGQLQLNQLATIRHNDIWGDSAVIRPLRDLGLDKGGPGGVAPPPPRPPTPPTPPPEPTPVPSPAARPTELIDPQTGEAVAGSFTEPPDIDDLDALAKRFDSDIPLLWKGDPETFLDNNAMRLASLEIGGNRATMELAQRMLKEQEAWVRAVGGAVETNYAGLSVRAAKEVNQAVEKTIIKNKWRPLDKIDTDGDYTGDLANCYAYQQHGNVHINVASTQYGSARHWANRKVASNTRKAAQRQDASLALREQRRKLKEAEEELKRAGLSKKEIAKEIKAKQKMVTLREKSFKEVQSGQWSVTNSIQETMVHEIGHYAHRRYGFMDEEALKVLAKPWNINKAQRHGAFDNYRRKYKKNRWAASYETQDDGWKLSQYGATNDHEFFAEAFADYIINDGKNLSPSVFNLVEDVIEANTVFPHIKGADVWHTEQFLGLQHRALKQNKNPEPFKHRVLRYMVEIVDGVPRQKQ